MNSFRITVPYLLRKYLLYHFKIYIMIIRFMLKIGIYKVNDLTLKAVFNRILL